MGECFVLFEETKKKQQDAGYFFDCLVGHYLVTNVSQQVNSAKMFGCFSPSSISQVLDKNVVIGTTDPGVESFCQTNCLNKPGTY